MTGRDTGHIGGLPGEKKETVSQRTLHYKCKLKQPYHLLTPRSFNRWWEHKSGLKQSLVSPSHLSPCQIEQLKSDLKEFSHSVKALGYICTLYYNSRGLSSATDLECKKRADCGHFYIKTFPCHLYFHFLISSNSLFNHSQGNDQTGSEHSSPRGACFNLVSEMARTSDCLSDGFVCLIDLTLSSLIFNADQFSAQNGGLQQALISKEASLPWLPITKPRPLQALRDLPSPWVCPVFHTTERFLLPDNAAERWT